MPKTPAPSQSREAVQQWRRTAVAYLVQRYGQRTAAELSELFAALCTAEGFEPLLWRSIDPNTMLGILRALENSGTVMRAGNKRDGRAGRNVPTWEISPTAERIDEVPNPEFNEKPAAANVPRGIDPPSDRATWAEMPRAQLYVLLEVLNDQAAVSARHIEATNNFLRDMRDFSERSRAKLIAAGFELPG